jgi:hypothetical protein
MGKAFSHCAGKLLFLSPLFAKNYQTVASIACRCGLSPFRNYGYGVRCHMMTKGPTQRVEAELEKEALLLSLFLFSRRKLSK